MGDIKCMYECRDCCDILQIRAVCHKCKWYNFIDSGFGECRALPPTASSCWGIFKRKFTYKFTVVPQCAPVCSLFTKAESDN